MRHGEALLLLVVHTLRANPTYKVDTTGGGATWTPAVTGAATTPADCVELTGAARTLPAGMLGKGCMPTALSDVTVHGPSFTGANKEEMMAKLYKCGAAGKEFYSYTTQHRPYDCYTSSDMVCEPSAKGMPGASTTVNRAYTCKSTPGTDAFTVNNQEFSGFLTDPERDAAATYVGTSTLNTSLTTGAFFTDRAQQVVLHASSHDYNRRKIFKQIRENNKTRKSKARGTREILFFIYYIMKILLDILFAFWMAWLVPIPHNCKESFGPFPKECGQLLGRWINFIVWMFCVLVSLIVLQNSGLFAGLVWGGVEIAMVIIAFFIYAQPCPNCCKNWCPKFCNGKICCNEPYDYERDRNEARKNDPETGGGSQRNSEIHVDKAAMANNKYNDEPVPSRADEICCPFCVSPGRDGIDRQRVLYCCKNMATGICCGPQCCGKGYNNCGASCKYGREQWGMCCNANADSANPPQSLICCKSDYNTRLYPGALADTKGSASKRTNNRPKGRLTRCQTIAASLIMWTALSLLTLDMGLFLTWSIDDYTIYNRQTEKVEIEIIPAMIARSQLLLWGTEKFLEHVGSTGANLDREFAAAVTGLCGDFFDKKLTPSEKTAKIKVGKIDVYDIDMSVFNITNYQDYTTVNDWFSRKINLEYRPMIADTASLKTIVGVADSRVTAFNVVPPQQKIWIKEEKFTMTELIGGPEHIRSKYTPEHKAVLKKFENGAMVIFRLAPQDYHCFHSPVSGYIFGRYEIPGALQSVSSDAMTSNNGAIYNERKIVIIRTSLPQGQTPSANTPYSDVGDVAYVAIGAACVGSVNIVNHDNRQFKSLDHINKGDYMGYMAFGGSTIVLAFEKDRVDLDKDLLYASQLPVENYMYVRQSVGISRQSRRRLREEFGIDTGL